MFGNPTRGMCSLTDQLAMVCPPWDARIMRFGAENAVVLNISTRTRTLLMVRGGRWFALTVVLDDEGDSIPGLPPAEDLGIPARATAQVFERVVRAQVAAYRGALQIPAGHPFYFMHEAAAMALPLLTASGR